MTRDSLYGEPIVWQGQCRAVSVPLVQKVMAAFAAVGSAVTLCYAIVVAKSLAAPVGGMILFAAWCATVALAAWRVPLWWRSKVEYIVTERHVIWRRGRLRRSIEIGQISYALIRWSAQDPTVGDLVIIRAVPTGALRRTLSVTLHDVLERKLAPRIAEAPPTPANSDSMAAASPNSSRMPGRRLCATRLVSAIARSASARRLSMPSLPRASAISHLTRPSLK